MMTNTFFIRFLHRNGTVVRETDLLARTIDQALFHVDIQLCRDLDTFEYEVWEYEPPNGEAKISRRRILRAKRPDRPINVFVRPLIRVGNFFSPITATLKAARQLRAQPKDGSNNQQISLFATFTRKLWFE